jgi:hypothetical protein
MIILQTTKRRYPIKLVASLCSLIWFSPLKAQEKQPTIDHPLYDNIYSPIFISPAQMYGIENNQVTLQVRNQQSDSTSMNINAKNWETNYQTPKIELFLVSHYPSKSKGRLGLKFSHQQTQQQWKTFTEGANGTRLSYFESASIFTGQVESKVEPQLAYDFSSWLTLGLAVSIEKTSYRSFGTEFMKNERMLLNAGLSFHTSLLEIGSYSKIILSDLTQTREDQQESSGNHYPINLLESENIVGAYAKLGINEQLIIAGYGSIKLKELNTQMRHKPNIGVSLTYLGPKATLEGYVRLVEPAANSLDEYLKIKQETGAILLTDFNLATRWGVQFRNANTTIYKDDKIAYNTASQELGLLAEFKL